MGSGDGAAWDQKIQPAPNARADPIPVSMHTHVGNGLCTTCALNCTSRTEREACLEAIRSLVFSSLWAASSGTNSFEGRDLGAQESVGFLYVFSRA